VGTTGRTSWAPARVPVVLPGEPEDFERTLCTAVDAGHDATPSPAMGLLGCLGRITAISPPRRLLPELEYHDRLLELADGSTS